VKKLKELRVSACNNLKLTSSFGVTAGWYVTALFLAWHWSADLLLAVLFGTAAGWAGGVLLAPYEEEDRHFKNISKVVSGIIGGASPPFQIVHAAQCIVMPPPYVAPVWPSP
jgi:hypothetical protein